MFHQATDKFNSRKESKNMHVIAEFHVKDKAEMNQRLEAAVVTALKEPLRETHGVLVTRHNFDQFSVALTPDVPFGLILERDVAPRK